MWLGQSQKTPSAPQKSNGPNFLLVKGSGSLTQMSVERSSSLLSKKGCSVSRGKAWVGSNFFFFFLELVPFMKIHPYLQQQIIGLCFYFACLCGNRMGTWDKFLGAASLTHHLKLQRVFDFNLYFSVLILSHARKTFLSICMPFQVSIFFQTKHVFSISQTSNCNLHYLNCLPTQITFSRQCSTLYKATDKQAYIQNLLFIKSLFGIAECFQQFIDLFQIGMPNFEYYKFLITNVAIPLKEYLN